MRIIMPAAELIIFVLGTSLIYYGIDRSVGIAGWSEFLTMIPRYLVLIVVLYGIYRNVYVRYLGVMKFDLKLPPLKLVVAMAMVIPFIFLAAHYCSFLFVRLKGGVFAADPVADDWTQASNLCGVFEAVFFAPILEELTMRVMMISQTQTKKGRLIAVVVSAVLFSVLHGRYYLINMLGGISFAVVLLATRNIWCPIICHSFLNLTVSCLSLIQFFNPGLVESDIDTGYIRVDISVMAIASILFFGGIILLHKNKESIWLSLRRRTEQL